MPRGVNGTGGARRAAQRPLVSPWSTKATTCCLARSTSASVPLGTVPSGTEAEVERAKQQVVAFVLLGLRSER